MVVVRGDRHVLAAKRLIAARDDTDDVASCATPHGRVAHVDVGHDLEPAAALARRLNAVTRELPRDVVAALFSPERSGGTPHHRVVRECGESELEIPCGYCRVRRNVRGRWRHRCGAAGGGENGDRRNDMTGRGHEPKLSNNRVRIVRASFTIEPIVGECRCCSTRIPYTS